jgi:hypothetical protein
MHDIAYTDAADRAFCKECAAIQPISPTIGMLSFLAATVPFKVGDVVEGRTGGQVYDGVGHIVEISFDPKDLASPVVPMFRVAMDEKAYDQVPDEIWYAEVCMRAKEAAK